MITKERRMNFRIDILLSIVALFICGCQGDCRETRFINKRISCEYEISDIRKDEGGWLVFLHRVPLEHGGTRQVKIDNLGNIISINGGEIHGIKALKSDSLKPDDKPPTPPDRH